MLTKRVIPCLDVKDGRVVKGVNFVNLRDAGDPVDLANAYDEQGADEVIFLDITATHEGRKTTIAMASRASEEVHIPYAVGGGFKNVADMRQMIAAGADKVSLNSAALADPSIITAGALAFGSQAILVAIDAKRASDGSDRWTAYVHGGRKDTGIDAIEWAREAARRGAGEILLTSMDCDGSKDGFDIALTRTVARAVDIPVIASGGVGKLEHFAQGIIEGEADASQRLSLRRAHGAPGEGVHGEAGDTRAAMRCPHEVAVSRSGFRRPFILNATPPPRICHVIHTGILLCHIGKG